VGLFSIVYDHWGQDWYFVEAPSLSLTSASLRSMPSTSITPRAKPIVPDHEGGRPIEVNACILITHMVYL
jgi:hypothetical protein